MHPLVFSIFASLPIPLYYAAQQDADSSYKHPTGFHIGMQELFSSVFIPNSSFIAFFNDIAHNFFMLKAMAKKAKSIVTLSL